VTVVLGRGASGQATTHRTDHGLARAGALATLRALDAEGSERSRSLELRGTKTVRAFDSQVIIVAVRARYDGRRRDFIGAVEVPDEDLVRGAVLATLDAVG